MPFQARGKEIIMKTIHGVYTSAKIFTVNEEAHALDDYAAAQLQALCDNEAFAGCKVRVMPDVHPSWVGTIGFTSPLGKRIEGKNKRISETRHSDPRVSPVRLRRQEETAPPGRIV